MRSQVAARPPGASSALLQQLRYFKDPYGVFRRCRERWGDPFLSPGFECDLVVTGRADGIRAIFAGDPTLFDPMSGEVMRLLFGDGTLLGQSGEQHRAARKLLTPPFHNARMSAYAALIERSTRARLARLPPGEPFDAETLTHAISLDVIIEAVFGVDERAWMDRFHAAMRALVAAIKPSFLVFASLRRDWPGLAWRRFLCARAVVHAMLAEAIAARRAVGGERPDILGMLLAARYEDGTGPSDQDIIDQLLTLVIAGHETTGMALQWALYELHRAPDVLATLRAELAGAGAETLTRLPYLGAVCDETLRLWPLVPAVSRKLRQPLELCGYTIPAGHAVVAAIVLAHRREEIYPEPDRFRPERFLQRSFGPFEFLPFGGGARRCLGAAFALFEMRIVLGTLLGEARFELLTPGPLAVKQRNAGVGPARPIRLVRRPAGATAGATG